MNMYFLTRKEARTYCKKMGIAYSKIGRPVNNENGSHSWVVNTDEVCNFEIGKSYKISDENGFVKPNPYSAVNTANRIQLQQINKFLNGVIKIKSIDNTKQVAEFESPVGVSFNTIRFIEAQYFTEVKPVVSAKPEPAPSPKPVKSLVVDVSPSLDDELNGGISLTTTTQEKDPTKWAKGAKYILVDRDGFLSSDRRNYRMVEAIDKYYNGIYEVVWYDDASSGGHIQRKNPKILCDDYLQLSERKFFSEIETGSINKPIVTSTKDILDAKYEQLINDIVEAQKEHDKAIVAVTNTAIKVNKAVNALAKLSK